MPYYTCNKCIDYRATHRVKNDRLERLEGTCIGIYTCSTCALAESGLNECVECGEAHSIGSQLCGTCRTQMRRSFWIGKNV